LIDAIDFLTLIKTMMRHNWTEEDLTVVCQEYKENETACRNASSETKLRIVQKVKDALAKRNVRVSNSAILMKLSHCKAIDDFAWRVWRDPFYNCCSSKLHQNVFNALSVGR
jgi:hypothetical protein